MNLRNKKKDTNKVTQAIFVIDESGSMSGCRSQTINGINEQIQELKKHDTIDVFTTLITFSGTVVDRLVNQPISDCEELTNDSYAPNGGTALYDAIAHAIMEEENRKYDTKDITRLLIIVTDGEENMSQEYSFHNDGSSKIAEMVKRVQKNGWTITYLGANQDLTEVHHQLGINLSNIASYKSNVVGTQAAFGTMTKGMSNYMHNRNIMVSSAAPDALATNFYSTTETIADIKEVDDD